MFILYDLIILLLIYLYNNLLFINYYVKVDLCCLEIFIIFPI